MLNYQRVTTDVLGRNDATLHRDFGGSCPMILTGLLFLFFLQCGLRCNRCEVLRKKTCMITPTKAASRVRILCNEYVSIHERYKYLLLWSFLISIDLLRHRHERSVNCWLKWTPPRHPLRRWQHLARSELFPEPPDPAIDSRGIYQLPIDPWMILVDIDILPSGIDHRYHTRSKCIWSSMDLLNMGKWW